jgi:Ca2+-binding EF-hand superfamily protein
MSSNVDKDKQKEEAEKQKRKEKKERQKHTEEENLKKIELQQSEKIRLNFVFNQLCELENEKSSDDDSKSKKYLRAINEKAKKKQMKIPKSKFKGKLETQNKKNYKIKDDEDMEEKEKKPSKKKFSRKALRKIIRKLCNEFAKDELDNMIWEVDENLDGYVSEEEFENMYKKCITDENEEEGKKLFYLTQFLMYDKDQKHEITVEDTLEILCARHQNNVDQALDAIFDIEKVDENGKKKKVKRETISFLEYSQRMHELSMKKRNEISNLKKTFCDNLKQEALKEAKERAERKHFEENQL